MASKLVLEFDSDELREEFLGQLCDGGIEDTIYEAMLVHDKQIHFDYSKAFKQWGWDGKGDPTVIVTEK